MLELHRGIIALINSAINKTKAELPDDFDWEKALAIAKSHKILPILHYGCNNSRIEVSPEIASFLKTALLKSAVLEERQNFHIEKMFSAFRENNIDFMPLKGAILRKYYPETGMRLMSDCDVLINLSQYEKTRQIMQEIGFEEGYESNHELVWEVPDNLTVELHKFIIPSYNKDYFEYFGDGWRLAKEKVGDTCEYRMTEEDALIYNFTHMAKHYRDGGIGIRHILDIYLYMNQCQDLDFVYIDGELKKLQLFDFFYNVLHTIDVWFRGKESDEMSDCITGYIFGSGAFGTARNRNISAAVKEKKTKKSPRCIWLKRWMDVIFLPYKSMCKKFPVLEKAPILLPVMWVVRGFRVVFGGKKHLITKANSNIKVLTADNIECFQDSLHYVGLDFNFKDE